MRTDLENGRLTVYLAGEIDHHAARQARAEIEQALQKTGSRDLRMDFSEVTFMDSSGIGLILGRYRKMQELNGHLGVVCATARMERMMRMAGLTRLNILEGVENP